MLHANCSSAIVAVIHWYMHRNVSEMSGSLCYPRSVKVLRVGNPHSAHHTEYPQEARSLASIPFYEAPRIFFGVAVKGLNI